MNTPYSKTSEKSEKMPSGNSIGVRADVRRILENSRFNDILDLQVSDMDDLIIFNGRINIEISDLMISEYHLDTKPDSFIEAFRTSSISKFNGEDSEKDVLMDLIEEKKRIYQELLAGCIRRGNFHFPQKDLEDIVNLIKSGVFEWKDSLYRKFAKIIEESGDIDHGENIYYGIPSGNDISGYRDSIAGSSVNPENIPSFNDKDLDSYIKDMIRLSSEGNFNYDDWIRAEKSEVRCWLGNGSLVFLAPMENYIHKNFVDPEFIVLLREKTDYDPRSFGRLSEKYFNDDFGMGKQIAFFAESILNGGDGSYSQFLGKTFPCDSVLRDESGTFIIIAKGEFPKTFDEYCHMIGKIFYIRTDSLLESKDSIVEGASDETLFHEYGHSLFSVKSSMLEETKASLFYWMMLFDRYIDSGEELKIEEINRIMLSFTFDFTRYISRLKNPKYKKYVYTSQVLLHHMMDNGLLGYDNEKNFIGSLDIKDDQETIIRFKSLLRDLMGVLDTIKDIYGTGDKKREENVLEYYDESTYEIIEKLYEKFNR